MRKEINILELFDLISTEEGRKEHRSFVEERLKQVLYRQEKYGFYSTKNLEEIEKEMLSLDENN